MNSLRSSVFRLTALSRCVGLRSSLLGQKPAVGLVVPLLQTRSYATAKAAPKARMDAKRAPIRRAVREEVEEEEEDEMDTPAEVISSDDVVGEVPQWNWIGEFPREDFSEKTDKVIAGTDFEPIPLDPVAFKEYFIRTFVFHPLRNNLTSVVADQFKHIRDCPIHYTHREYIGTGMLRGKRVPGTNKISMRLNVADLGFTEGQRKYFAALAGKRFHPGKGELKLACALYTLPEGTSLDPFFAISLLYPVLVPVSLFRSVLSVALFASSDADNIRYLYDLTSRLVDESLKGDAIDAALAAGRNPDEDPAVKVPSSPTAPLQSLTIASVLFFLSVFRCLLCEGA